MADVLADIEQFEVEIDDTAPFEFSADTDNELQLTAEDYKVIGLWGTIGGNIDNQKDLIERLQAIQQLAQVEAISDDFINNLA